ncbi:MAG: hypothetical protein ACPGU1_22280, partial [Myxococcota bacterium]
MRARTLFGWALAVCLLTLTGCSTVDGGGLGGASDVTVSTPDVTAPADVTGVEEVVEADVTPGPCDGLKDGDLCDDQNACTADDQCFEGICTGSTSVTCDDAGPCRAAVCDPVTGCSYSDSDDGEPCQMACFGSATCLAGQCEADPESAVTCPSPDADEPCVLELRCEAVTGACTKKIFHPVETACDNDENLCTVEACDDTGTCLSNDSVVSCESAAATEPCWTFECQPVTGDCIPQLFVEGNSCDDGNPCTANDTCQSEEDDPKGNYCLGQPVPVDDQNPCTDDQCVQGEVIHSALDGVPCVSGDTCAPVGLCTEGTCVFEGCECYTDSDCPPDDPCLGASSCGPSGTCVVDPESIVTCPAPEDPCTVALCDPTSGECTTALKEVGASCEDGDPCTQEDSCDADGVCEGQAYSCEDPGPCSTNVCLGDGTCEVVSTSASCDDGDPCTQGDLCTDGTCAGMPYVCGDPGVCFDTSCQGDGTCEVTPNTAACDDGDPCTQSDLCNEGTCAGEAVLCPASDNPCSVTTCVDGGCVEVSAEDGTVCDDGDPCTHGDTCADGACTS